MLRSRNIVPPGGFTFTEERTCLKFKEMSFDALINKVIAHREYKNLGPTNRDQVIAEVESDICSRVPKRLVRD